MSMMDVSERARAQRTFDSLKLAMQAGTVYRKSRQISFGIPRVITLSNMFSKIFIVYQ